MDVYHQMLKCGPTLDKAPRIRIVIWILPSILQPLSGGCGSRLRISQLNQNINK